MKKREVRVSIERLDDGKVVESHVICVQEDASCVDEWTSPEAVAIARCAKRMGTHPIDVVVTCVRDPVSSMHLFSNDPFVLLAKAYLAWDGAGEFEDDVQIVVGGKQVTKDLNWPEPR